MTKQSYSSTLVHTDDATFRTWGLQLSTALQACGLVKTADTGQIDWTTVARPAINTNAGYEMYRFNDALQATAPVFLRIDYGTTSTATIGRVQVTVGTGTNGTGTITGVILSVTSITRNSATTQAGTSYITHTNGFFLLGFALGSLVGTGGFGTLVIDRSRDDTGTVLPEAVYLMWSNSTGQCFSTTYVYATSTALAAATANIGCTIPGNIQSTTVGTDVQVFRHYVMTPRVRNSILLTYLNAEFSTGSVFSLAAVGSTPRFYLPLGTNGPSATVGAGSGTAFPVLAVLWED